MNLITNPKNYEICFNIASLVVLFVTFLIHLSEEQYYGKQSDIFGGLIFNAVLMNVLELVHNVWIQVDPASRVIGYDAVCVLVMLEKACIYTTPILSMRYVMALFRIHPSGFGRKLFFVSPTIFSMLFVFPPHFEWETL